MIIGWGAVQNSSFSKKEEEKEAKMCWGAEIDTMLVCDRDEQLSLLKSELKRLKEAKKEIEGKISAQWRKIGKVCGHPKARISGWSKSTCIDCGYYASTKYFMDCGSVLIDVDGRDVAEKEKEERERRRNWF